MYKPNSPYDEGFKSYFDNGGNYRNPYPLNSPAFNDYERGWTQALKRNGVLPSIQEDYKWRYGNAEPIYRPPVEPYKPATRNPYAEAKGRTKNPPNDD